MLQEELKTVWNKTLNNEIASWSKYEEFSQGLFETTVGQLHDSVLATCKQDDLRWLVILRFAADVGKNLYSEQSWEEG
jgi:hypothetical protein